MSSNEQQQQLPLLQSTRLKGYFIISLSSIIHLNSATIEGTMGDTPSQRTYSIANASVSLILSGLSLLIHLDNVSPLRQYWRKLYADNNRFELWIAIALVLHWSIANAWCTSVQGISGDGKGRDSLYYSAWVCWMGSVWITERKLVALGSSSLQEFIKSWPHRSGGWLCVFVLNVFTLIWYVDLWINFDKLDREEEAALKQRFESIPTGYWQWILTMLLFTAAPSIGFIIVELFRESNTNKGRVESILEGMSLWILVLGWIPTIMMATTTGPAALIGNAYFSSWLLVVFLVETAVWYIHDVRSEIHRKLRHQRAEYLKKQREILQKVRNKANDQTE